MPDSPSSTRDAAAFGLAALLVITLLAVAREVLSPPVVLGLLFLVLWPLRQKTGVRPVLVAASLVTLLWLWHDYGAFLGPFVAALALAYLLAPAVQRLQGLGARRPLAVAGILVPLLALAVLGVLERRRAPSLAPGWGESEPDIDASEPDIEAPEPA